MTKRTLVCRTTSNGELKFYERKPKKKRTRINNKIEKNERF